MKRRYWTLVMLSLLLGGGAFVLGKALLTGSSRIQGIRGERKIPIFCTTTILADMVKGIGGEAVDVSTLIPPDSCPGHFDLKAKDLKKMAQVRLIFRHDFQEFLADRINEINTAKVQTITIAGKGHIVPEYYMNAAREIYSVLARQYPARRSEWRRNLERLEDQVGRDREQVQQWAREQKAGMKKVIVSVPSEPFVRWMGCQVVSTYDQLEVFSPREMEKIMLQAKKNQANLVVGTLQRGGQEAKVLSQKLGLPYVLVSNFPGPGTGGKDYHDLLLANAKKLLGMGTEG